MGVEVGTQLRAHAGGRGRHDGARRALTWCALLVCVVSAACREVDARQRLRVPVVVVALDSVPARLVGLAGGAAWTPVLDELGRQGLVYAACLASDSASDDTLASALRGTHDPAAQSLAEVLEGAGWRTHAIVSHGSVATPEVLAGFSDVRRLGADDEAGALASDAVHEALAVFDSSDPRPPFLLLHLADARPPHHRYPGLVAACDEPYSGPCTAALPHAELLRLAPTFEARDFDRLVALAASEVAAVDRALGALLEGLARRGLTDEVVVAVVGTRGAWLGEGDRVGLVPGLDPEVLHVPLVLRLPARISAARSGLVLRGMVDMLVTTTDLAPTLCDALELELDAESEGAPELAQGEPTPAARGALPVVALQGHGRTASRPDGPELTGRTVGRSILPGAPAEPRVLRFGSRRGQALAAVYTEGAGMVRDLEHGVERVVRFGGTSLLEAERTAVERGLASELDAWLGPLPRTQPKSTRTQR
jgi:hypothetical protein